MLLTTLALLKTPPGFVLDKWATRWLGHSPIVALGVRRDKRAPQPVLVLETRGRRSGRRRTAVLPYYRHDGKIYVIGSVGGAPKDAQWVENLRADPDVVLYIRRRRRRMRARIATGRSGATCGTT